MSEIVMIKHPLYSGVQAHVSNAFLIVLTPSKIALLKGAKRILVRARVDERRIRPVWVSCHPEPVSFVARRPHTSRSSQEQSHAL